MQLKAQKSCRMLWILLKKLSPKREHMLGVIKENLERKTEGNEEIEPSLAKFSATRWTVRAVCFKRILKNAFIS